MCQQAPVKITGQVTSQNPTVIIYSSVLLTFCERDEVHITNKNSKRAITQLLKIAILLDFLLDKCNHADIMYNTMLTYAFDLTHSTTFLIHVEALIYKFVSLDEKKIH